MIILLGAILLAGCGKQVDDRLARVHELADCGKADSARVVLGGIDRSALDTYNQRYHDLMTIKTADKLYEKHTSDSLIVSVISYFEKYGDERIVPEAHYYGGRVYSDLGDAPRALAYFQKVLDELDDSQARLKGKTASQMGQLFSDMSMFEQAKPKFQEAIKYGIMSNDSVGLMYDYRNLGETYKWLNLFDSTFPYYNKALDLVRRIDPNGINEVELRAYIAEYYLKTGDLERSLSEFHKVEQHELFPQGADFLYIMGTSIYFYNKDYKKAETYAKRLVHSASVHSQAFAYNALKEISRARNDMESMCYNIVLYGMCVDSINRTNSSSAVIHQNSFYNYSVYERETHELRSKNEQSYIFLLAMSVIILLLAVTALWLYLHNRTLKFNLTMQLAEVNSLTSGNLRKEDFIPKKESAEQIRDKIISKYNQIIGNFDYDKYFVSDEILKSEIYNKLKQSLNYSYVKLGQSDWDSLSEVVNSSYPDFKFKLQILCNSISDFEYCICLLIKCKFTPTEIGKLTSHSIASITNARRRLFSKIFFRKGTPIDCDNLIMSL